MAGEETGKDAQHKPQVSRQKLQPNNKTENKVTGAQNTKQSEKSEPKQQTEQGRRKPPKLGPRKGSSQPSTKREGGDSKDGEDLTTILDETQRADLTLLLANATASMRKLIEENFDATAGLNRALLKENMTEDEKLMSADIDPATANVAALDRERKLKEKYEKELGSSKMKDLKRDALKAFDEWREAVMERVGQVVNSERTVQKQLENEVKAGKAQPQAPDQNPLDSVVKRPADQDVKLKFRDLFPPTKTSLTKHYNAPSRVLLLHLTSSLKLPLKTFEQDESTVAKGLLEAAKELSADDETKKKAEANKENRKWKVGLATAAGAAVIGISGGMAAPLVSAGVGTIMGSLGLGATAAAGYLGSVAGSTVLVGGLFGAYGGRMTGQMMDKYAREVEDFEFLPVHSRNKTSEKAEEGAKQASEHNHKLRVTICISGWLTEKDEVVSPWKVIGRGAEVFALKWELEALLNLGNAMNGLVQSAAWGYAQKQLIQQTIFADLMAAMWPVGLIKAAGVIDNPFSVAKQRSEKAGEVLADALINRAQGERPVTLIGYSLGARVIYTCLMSLARRKAFGLVESAVLIGAPIPSDTSDWRMLRTAVTARLVNVYSENDYVLGFMYRTSSVQYGVAGLQAVEGLAGVENINVSEDVKGHLRYRYLIGSILKKIGFDDIDMQAVKEEHVALEKMVEEEKKNSLRAQKNRLLRRQSTGGTEDEAKEAEEEADEIQKQVAAKTQKSLVTRVVEYFYLPKTMSAKDVEKNLGSLQKAAADPGEAGAVAMEAIRDLQASGQSYAQWAAQKLPSLPGRGGGGAASATKTPSKAATGAAETTSKTVSSAASTARSYTQAAANYLPSFGGGKKKSNDPAKSVGDAAKGAENVVDQTPVAGTAKDVIKPTIVNASKTVGNVASSGKDAAAGAETKAEDAIDQTPAKVVKDTAKPTVVNATGVAGNTAEGAKEATSRATAKGQETVSNTASSAKDKVGEVASGTQKAASGTAASAQSYTQRAAGYLPSLGGGGKKATSDGKNATKGPTKAAGDTTGSAQGYASKAAGYLPGLGGGKKAAQDSSKATKQTTKDSSKAASDFVKGSSKVGEDTAKTTSKAAENVTDGIKEVTKGKKPSVPDVQKAATSTEESAKSYTSQVSGYLPSLPSIPGRTGSAAADGKRKISTGEKADRRKSQPTVPQDASAAKQGEKVETEDAKATPEAQSYTSRATAYLPSVPGFGQGKRGAEAKLSAPNKPPSETKKAASKIERKPSEASKSVSTPERKASEAKMSAGELERKGSEVKSPPNASRKTSVAKKPIPKLDRKSSEAGAASPQFERTKSGAQKSIPKLDRTPSGIREPPTTPKLERAASGAQKSIPELGRTTSGVKNPQSKLGRSASGVKSGVDGVAGGVTSGLSKGQETVSGGLGKGQEGLKKGLGGLGGAFGGGK